MQKFKKLASITSLSTIILFTNLALLQAAPLCQLTTSDPDGDGWGWESQSSCMVQANSSGTPVCVDGDETDPDDDGWGWENHQSCLVVEDDDDDHGESDDEEEWDVASLYFELNNTDGDLGFHGLMDAVGWVHLEIENPVGDELMDVKLDNELKVQSLTELFFESTEPNFDDLDPQEFFQRFMEGEYLVEATRTTGAELSSTSTVSHRLPAPPANLMVNGLPLPDSCDATDLPAASAPLTVSWDPVTMSHPTLGRTGESVQIENYELVVEGDDDNEFKFAHVIPADMYSMLLATVPGGSGAVIKMEVLVKEENGNQTATETCFVLQ